MTELPTLAVKYVCTTPSALDATQSSAIRPTIFHSSPIFGPVPPGGKSPTSKACSVSSGGNTEIAAVMSTSTSAIAIFPR